MVQLGLDADLQFHQRLEITEVQDLYKTTSEMTNFSRCLCRLELHMCAWVGGNPMGDPKWEILLNIKMFEVRFLLS